MSRMTMSEAIVAAISDAMTEDQSVYLMGQDIGVFGGPMQSARGLWDQFGTSGRIIDAPISEAAMVGSAVGAAMSGSRPIVDLMFAEFLALVVTPLALEGGSVAFKTQGEVRVPLVVRAKWGIGPHRGHAESCIGMLMSFPGIKIVVPTTPQDAYSLMRASIADNNPVVFLEHMSLLHGAKAEVCREVTDLLGTSAVRRSGTDATIAASGLMVSRCVRAAKELAENGLEVEVLDLRSIAPLDAEPIGESAERTGHLLIVEESWPVGGPASELVSKLIAGRPHRSFEIAVLQPPSVPIPFSSNLERSFVPQIQDIVTSTLELVNGSADRDRSQHV